MEHGPVEQSIQNFLPQIETEVKEVISLPEDVLFSVIQVIQRRRQRVISEMPGLNQSSKPKEIQ